MFLVACLGNTIQKCDFGTARYWLSVILGPLALKETILTWFSDLWLYGGGGTFFSSRVRNWGDCLTVHSPPALLFLKWFFEVEISMRKLIPLFRPGSVHGGSASWDGCNRAFPDELHVISFPGKTPTLCLDSGIDFDGSRVSACLGVTCHQHFWQNDWDLLHAAAVTWGWNGHQIRVSTQSWLWRRKFSRSCGNK